MQRTNALAQAGIATALTVVLSLAGWYIPVLSGIIFFLIPIPIAYLGLNQGVKWSITVTAAAFILDTIFMGLSASIFILTIFGALGVIIGAGYRYKWKPIYTLLLGGIAVLIGLIICDLIVMYVIGGEPMILGGAMINEIESGMKTLLPEIYSGDSLEKAMSQMNLIVENMRKTVPVAIAGASLFYALFAMTISKVVFHKMGIKNLPSIPPFEKWNLPVYLVYAYIFMLAIRFILPENEWTQLLVYNLTPICTISFYIQGLSCVWWAYHKYPVMKKLRLIILILSLFIPILQLGVIFVGIMDMTLKYRQKTESLQKSE